MHGADTLDDIASKVGMIFFTKMIKSKMKTRAKCQKKSRNWAVKNCEL